MRDERGDVGGEEVLALADADDQRRVAAGGDDAVGGVGVHGEQRERAVEAAADRAHGVDQVGPGGDLGGQQVRDDLGVGLGGEPDAGVLQLGAEPGEVLDDAVVDDGDPAGLVEVRVGVTVGGRAVRGPPGVTEPGARHRQRPFLQRLLQVHQLPGPLGRGQRAVGDDRHARGVVTAVFEPAQPLDDDVERWAMSCVSHDPAHGGHCNRTRPRIAHRQDMSVRMRPP